MKKIMKNNHYRKFGFLLHELLVALAIIALVMIPLASYFFEEGKLFNALYFRSVAEQILDGEREVLMAGEWKKYPVGKYSLSIKNKAFEQLPEKDIYLTVSDVGDNKRKFVLSWTPAKSSGIKKVQKEVILNVD